MTRLSLGRRLIIREYEKLVESGDVERVNVVRTIATRVGYVIDRNGNSTFVRQVIKEITGNG